MIFITKLLNNLKRKKEERLAVFDFIEKKNKEKANTELFELKRKMDNEYCPINKGSCSRTCVHYKKGEIDKYLFSDRPYAYYVIPPKCKLWNDKI